MTLSRPLLWKEWSESRSVLIISAIIFVVFPLIGALEHIIQYGRFEIWTSPWVISLGGVLAVVGAVGSIIPDVTRRFEFIQSQPIPLTRWLLAKYAVGLSVVLTVLVVSLALEAVTDRSTTSTGFHLAALLVTLPFTWIAIYSIAFALACVIRRTALTVVAGIFAMVVLYFLPPLVPGLEMLSLDRVTNDLGRRTFGNTVVERPGLAALHPSYFVFTATFLAIGLLALSIAIAAVHRDWRIESNRRTIAWAIAFFVLAPITTASLQLGTNMPVLQTFDLNENEQGNFFMSDSSGGGILFTSEVISISPVNHQATFRPFARRVTAGPQVTIGPKIPFEKGIWGFWNMSPAQDIYYSLGAEVMPDSRPADQQFDSAHLSYPILSAIHVQDKSIQSTALEMKENALTDFGGVPIYAYHGSTMIAILGKHELSFDITDPMHPKLVSLKPLSIAPHLDELPDGYTFLYPLEATMSADEMLAGFEHDLWWGSAWDLKTFIVVQNGKLRCYSRVDSPPGMVKFQLAGQSTPSPLEQMLYHDFGGRVGFNNGLFAASNHPVINLFDVSDPTRPRRIGHFVDPARSYQILSVLRNGRVLLSTFDVRQLIVLGKP